MIMKVNQWQHGLAFSHYVGDIYAKTYDKSAIQEIDTHIQKLRRRSFRLRSFS